MENNQFVAILEILVPRIVQLIMDSRQLSNHDAAELFYSSELYAMLEREKSKLWHLSAPALYDLLEEELSTGVIAYPEEA